MPSFKKIDVHSHYLPEQYRKTLAETGHANPDGMPAIPKWSEEEHLEMMEAVNISKSILSISSPGTYTKPGDYQLARDTARHCNEVAGDLKKRRPEQFGFWASLPLPDVQGSLDEIAYSFDTLNADGVAVETNHHGTYLGHKDFDAVFDELNRRKSIVFIHPTTPCMSSGQPAIPLQDLPRPMFEFFFDTARAVINLFVSGTVRRCPNVTFLIPHAGGALPPLIKRFSSIPGLLKLPICDQQISPDWVKERLNKQFYFDTAGWPLPDQIRGLLPYVTIERLLYGSDFPFTPLPAVVALANDHDQHLPSVFPKEEDQEALYSRNAIRLLK